MGNSDLRKIELNLGKFRLTWIELNLGDIPTYVKLNWI